MDTSALAVALVSMNAARTQSAANIAVLKKQFEMQRSVLDLLTPPPRAPAPAGMGQHVDKLA
jgi:hypothetical protein